MGLDGLGGPSEYARGDVGVEGEMGERGGSGNVRGNGEVGNVGDGGNGDRGDVGEVGDRGDSYDVFTKGDAGCSIVIMDALSSSSIPDSVIRSE